MFLNGGRLKQTLRMTSIGDKGTVAVYQRGPRHRDWSDVTVAQEHGVPLGIENDEITGGTRILSDGRKAATVF